MLSREPLLWCDNLALLHFQPILFFILDPNILNRIYISFGSGFLRALQIMCHLGISGGCSYKTSNRNILQQVEEETHCGTSQLSIGKVLEITSFGQLVICYVLS